MILFDCRRLVLDRSGPHSGKSTLASAQGAHPRIDADGTYLHRRAGAVLTPAVATPPAALAGYEAAMAAI